MSFVGFRAIDGDRFPFDSGGLIGCGNAAVERHFARFDGGKLNLFLASFGAFGAV